MERARRAAFCGFSFAPPGLGGFVRLSHGSRRGLPSIAPLRAEAGKQILGKDFTVFLLDMPKAGI